MYSKLPILVALVSLVLMSLGFNSPGVALAGVTTTTTGLTTGGTTGSHTIGIDGYTLSMTNLDEKKSTSSWGNFSGSTWSLHTGVHIAGIQFTASAVSSSTTTTDAHLTGQTDNTWILVDPGTEIGLPSGVTASSKTTPTSVVVEGFQVGSGTTVDVQTSASGAITGTHDLTYWIYTSVTNHYDNAADSEGSIVWTHYKYHLYKLDCGDASVTNRKTYGQPNTAGEYPADANAPLRYVKYGAWDYKGGNFIGNMPSGGADRSGTARLDLFPSGGSSYSTYGMAALSMYDLGKPSVSGCSGAIDTGVYIPSSLGSCTESTVTWGNQFTFTPDTSYASHQTLTDGTSNDYLIFKIASGSLAGLSVAVVNESSVVTAGTTCWHYFASTEYKGEQSSFPGNDSEPRVWVIVAYT